MDRCVILMLTDIILSLCLIILQIVVLQLRFFPFHGQDLVIKVRIVASFDFWQIFHQTAEIFPDIFEFRDAGAFNIIGVKDLIQELRLRHDLGDVGDACDSGSLGDQIVLRPRIFLPRKACQLDAVHEGIEAKRGRLIRLRLDQRGKFFPDLERILVCKSLIIVPVRIEIHILQMLPDRKVFPIQLLHLSDHMIHKGFPVGCKPLLLLVLQILQLVGNLEFQVEDRSLKSDHIRGRFSSMHTEEFKVSAEIKDIKLTLVFPVDKTRTQPGSAADHLPELGLAHDLLEKDQVQDLRHIDAGIQHIYGNGNLRQLLRLRKIINRALRVGSIIVDHFRKAGKMRVLFIKDITDLFGVFVISCKDDGLAEFRAVIDLQPMLHQNVQDFADRIVIEEPVIQGRGGDAVRHIAIFIFKCILIFLLVFFREVIIYDALLNEFQLCFHRHEIDQISVRNGLRQIIAVGGNALLQLKNPVGILIDFVLRSCCQTDQGSVKVIEDILIPVVNGPVGLVADNQIEMSAGKELALIIFDRIDAVHHGLVG